MQKQLGIIESIDAKIAVLNDERERLMHMSGIDHGLKQWLKRLYDERTDELIAERESLV